MKRFCVVLALIIYGEILSGAENSKLFSTEYVNELIVFFRKSEDGVPGKIALGEIPDARVMYFESGNSDILANNHETMLLLRLKKKSGEGRASTVVFRFTLAPQLPNSEKVTAKELEEFLNSRKITQYLIVEYQWSNGSRVAKTLGKNCRANRQEE